MKKKVVITLDEVGMSLDAMQHVGGLSLPVVQAFLFSENTREIEPVAQNFVEKRAQIVRDNVGEEGSMAVARLLEIKEYQDLLATKVELELYIIDVLKLGSCEIQPGALSALHYMFTIGKLD